jgi:hypothetical protein
LEMLICPTDYKFYEEDDNQKKWKFV